MTGGHAIKLNLHKRTCYCVGTGPYRLFIMWNEKYSYWEIWQGPRLINVWDHLNQALYDANRVLKESIEKDIK